ncbi:hypothetical protein [Streptomyces noursei]|uniref:hypothetical protein n=1 Tax=Streptomyces noursei TaxID=1971 RepID=UPI0023B84E7E|nr:hypothetical protein [Streptomyces noursei]
MKTFIGRHQALTDTDYLELALGTPLELWLGEDDETDEERAARLDVAREILDEDPGLYDRALKTAAKSLTNEPTLAVLPTSKPQTAAVRTVLRTAVAA